MKLVVDHFAVRIDDHRPGCPPRSVVDHGLGQPAVVVSTPVMGHGNIQAVFDLVFAQFVTGIGLLPFKGGLDSQQGHTIIATEGLCEVLQGREAMGVAAWTTVLKKVEIDHLATQGGQIDFWGGLAMAVYPGGEINLGRLLA